MKKETKEQRSRRINERKAAKELNNIGKRLSWLRERLNLTQREVCDGTGIPTATYSDREIGIRTEYTEEYLVLSAYFDTLYQRKYSSAQQYPMYEGEHVKKITPMWLQYGHENQDYESIISDFKIKMQKIEMDNYNRQKELERQLNLFFERRDTK